MSEVNNVSAGRDDVLQLEMISDVVCPWCFIGKRRVERAAALLDRGALIRWIPYELNPQIPVQGIDRRT